MKSRLTLASPGHVIEQAIESRQLVKYFFHILHSSISRIPGTMHNHFHLFNLILVMLPSSRVWNCAIFETGTHTRHFCLLQSKPTADSQRYLIYARHLIAAQEVVMVITIKLDNRCCPPSLADTSASNSRALQACIIFPRFDLLQLGSVECSSLIIASCHYAHIRRPTSCVFRPKSIYNFTNPPPFLASGCSSRSSDSLLICDFSGFCITLCLLLINILAPF